MKNVFIVFIALIILIGLSGYSWYDSSYRGIIYYSEVYKGVKPVEERVQHIGNRVVQYTYYLRGFDEKGKSQQLKFSTISKVKSGIYLQVFLNKNRKVTSWVACDRSEIPRHILEKID